MLGLLGKQTPLHLDAREGGFELLVDSGDIEVLDLVLEFEGFFLLEDFVLAVALAALLHFCYVLQLLVLHGAVDGVDFVHDLLLWEFLLLLEDPLQEFFSGLLLDLIQEGVLREIILFGHFPFFAPRLLFSVNISLREEPLRIFLFLRFEFVLDQMVEESGLDLSPVLIVRGLVDASVDSHGGYFQTSGKVRLPQESIRFEGVSRGIFWQVLAAELLF